MELIYKVKKPETIQRFIKENHIPTSILERDEKFYKIYVNKKIRSRKDTVRKGDKIHFQIIDEELEKIMPQDLPLEIVYEDEQILIVNKPVNMKMMISKKHQKETLANAIMHHYKQNKINAKLHFINRLDTDTSGIVMLVKHKFIKFLLSDKFDNEVVFKYKAIVDGEVPVKDFNICLPISIMKESNLREVSEAGKDCETKYKVVKEWKSFSLLDIEVKNKITHQIKVHLAHFDFPIVGDKYYNKNKYPVKRLLLHNSQVKFTHPITEESIIVKTELPEAFEEFTMI
ncbi:MAG: RluA family pseudouridine synthase [Tenericutes bacterium]|jgi:23S rRNA pseudouridine1911/1915/1917 synthase|nr:RluA family pseudouridine synthase [Mycoplasmatota bacterium]